MGDDVGKKGHKLCAGVSRCGFAEHATVLSVKGRVQRERTVAAILKAVTFGPSGRQRQHWIKAVKCLNRRLFVHTKNDRMGRRIEIQPDNVGGLNLKLRVVRCHVALKSMRSQAMLDPYSRYHHMRYAERLTQLTTRPVRRAAARSVLSPGQNPRFELRLVLCRCTAPMPSIEPAKPILIKTPSPPINVVWRARQLFTDALPAQPIIQHDHQPRTLDIGRGRNRDRVNDTNARRSSLVRLKTDCMLHIVLLKS